MKFKYTFIPLPVSKEQIKYKLKHSKFDSLKEEKK